MSRPDQIAIKGQCAKDICAALADGQTLTVSQLVTKLGRYTRSQISTTVMRLRDSRKIVSTKHNGVFGYRTAPAAKPFLLSVYFPAPVLVEDEHV